MAAGAVEPLRVPAAFWPRDDVGQALDRRDIGELFRLLRRYCGASQHRIGATTGITQGYVCTLTKGASTVTSIDVLERIAGGLRMPDDARMRLGLAPKEDPMKRRTALGLGLIGTLDPSILTSVLQESAAEALEFTREQAVSAVGEGTLEHLSAVITELDRAYEWRPAAELFPVARAYRQRVAQLINGQHTLREARELYVQAAHLSYLLSDLASDLGSHATAQAYAIDSYRHADQAGHDELCAWASSSQVCWTLEAGQPPAKAVAAAERGIARAPRHSPIAARLHARAAAGHARQGNHTAFVEALAKAQDLCERLPDESPSRLSTESSALTRLKIIQNAAYSQTGLGDYQDGARLAREALAVAAWSPGSAEMTRLDLGVCLANLGQPDEAAEHGNRALSQPKQSGSLLLRARELDATLTNRYPKEPGTQQFHDRFQQFASRAITN